MITQLNQLERKLEQLFKKGELRDIRVVFDIGVEFGALLQSQNVQNYKYKFWNKLDADNIKGQKIRDAVESINDFLLMLVRKSIKEYITKNGSWSISKHHWSSMYSEIEQDTLKKYCVQITSLSMTEYGGDFQCKFEMTGKLAKLFKSNNIYNELDVDIYNDIGEESMSIYDVEDVDENVSRLNCHVRNVNNWELEQYTEFLNEIKECFLTDLLIEA